MHGVFISFATTKFWCAFYTLRCGLISIPAFSSLTRESNLRDDIPESGVSFQRIFPIWVYTYSRHGYPRTRLFFFHLSIRRWLYIDDELLKSLSVLVTCYWFKTGLLETARAKIKSSANISSSLQCKREKKQKIFHFWNRWTGTYIFSFVTENIYIYIHTSNITHLCHRAIYVIPAHQSRSDPHT